MSDWDNELVRRVATAVRALREVNGMSAQNLSDATDDLGHRVTRALIADLESGRRKYVSASELAMFSAALGVTPGVLLTWGLIPDGQVEVVPGRWVSGWEALRWWGGTSLNPFATAARGLPRDNQRIAELLRACAERDRLRETLIRSRIGGLDIDRSIIPAVEDQLSGVLQRIRDLGGVIADDDKEK